MQAQQENVVTSQTPSASETNFKRPILNCIKGEISVYACESKTCQKYAFVCQNRTCECRRQHKKCWIVESQSIFKSLQGKSLMSKNLQEIIENCYQKIIDKLSCERDELVDLIRNNAKYLGLNQHQKLFIKNIDSGIFNQIVGYTIWNIHLNLQNEIKMAQQIQVTQKQIEKMLAKQVKHQNQITKNIQKILKNNLNLVKIEQKPNISTKYNKIKDFPKQLPGKKQFSKSILVFDVKARDSQADFNQIWRRIQKQVILDGLTWDGIPSIRPIAFGLQKLRCKCIINNNKIHSIQDITDIILSWQQTIQSIDIVQFQG